MHHSYYNFRYLSEALRRRGWDAVSVAVTPPDSPSAKYHHGADLDLYDPDPAVLHRRLTDFVGVMPQRFGMAHFYGIGHMSFYPEKWDNTVWFEKVPIDFLYLKSQGLRLGCTTSGCLDGAFQSSFNRWSGGCCEKCVWQLEPNVCSDRRNRHWGAKRDLLIDLFATEGNPALDYQGNERCFREPLTQALNPDIWDPSLEVPERLQVGRAPGEVLVYHAVGNLSARSRHGRNIKGSPAVLAAVQQLQSEGLPVRMITANEVPSLDVRFLQLQADIVVDQLNFGRYGSTAREALMLGKPTICRIDPSEPPGIRSLTSLAECPIVSADEATVYLALRELAESPERRREIGARSRDFALKWFAMDACAARFEAVHDAVAQGISPAECERRMFGPQAS